MLAMEQQGSPLLPPLQFVLPETAEKAWSSGSVVPSRKHRAQAEGPMSGNARDASSLNVEMRTTPSTLCDPQVFIWYTFDDNLILVVLYCLMQVKV